jgi:predicted RecB family nuclease
MKTVSGKIHLSATDLSNHLGCRHLTELNRLVALGKRNKPDWSDPALAILAKRGAEHEDAYVKYLKASGRTVVNLNGMSVQATIEAMRKGIDVIVQAELLQNDWNGRADILIKVESKSSFGNWSYEVQDAKLSRNTRAGTLLQLSLYTDMVHGLQGAEPVNMYVVKPGEPFSIEEFRYADFKAYYRLVRTSLSQVIGAEPLATYPEPVAQCDICRWWKTCDKQRHDDDHLSLIANIRSMHIGELQKHEIKTLEQFARRDDPFPGKPDRGTLETYGNIHGQAKIQLEGKICGELLYELLDVETGRGLSRLPAPSKGDIYFDIEADPFFDQLGLEYLFGYAFMNEKGETEYERVWAKSRVEEKQAFGKFMNFVMDRLKQFRDLHIYHFSPYEPSAIKRLSLRHSIHEADLDWLLRAERFVDLYAVVKEGLRASVEHYSLKDLERFTKYLRKVELPVASSARRTVEFALELGDHDSLTNEILGLVEDYNEDDCRATQALHKWLEQRREELILKTGVTRPELKTGEATETIEELEVRAKAIFRDLTKTLPDDREKWTTHDKAKWLLANQVDYFRRESKSAWWEFFRLHEMDYEEILNERKGIAGLRYIGDVALKGRAKLPIHRYSYPLQEVGIEEGDIVHQVMGEKIGTVYRISHQECIIEIKKTEQSKDLHPICVHQEEVVTIEPLATAICDIANSILFDGIESMPYKAAKDLLLKSGPRLATSFSGKVLNDGEPLLEGAVRIASEMKATVLGIQGPPGSGKTHTGAIMILQLAQQGKRIGVTAPSHKVIRNLFDKVLELAKENNITINLVHKPKEKSESLPMGLEETDDNQSALKAIDQKKVVGGTAWLWARNDAREVLDYLFVDEAGQMSLAHVLAASRSAKNIILLGDPQQLQQPQKAAHPEGADVAALTHLLDGHKTMPDNKGIFLTFTRRLHPRIKDFTSELFYDSRLQSLAGLEKQRVHADTVFSGAGLFYVPLEHQGNQNRSPEEVDAIEKIVRVLISPQVTWTNNKNERKNLTRHDILIVAPYNAQVVALTERLPEFQVGTVDKFQGQEAAVVIYSMTSSSSQDAPRGMGFLYNPNRLNVATSRAQCICILVASSDLLQADCRSVEQMKWANALCRYKELATVVDIRSLQSEGFEAKI